MTRAWTADELGREVGLSRSALAERFTRLIGVAPMHYLANWRMQVAAQELRSRSTSLLQVANTGRLRVRGRLLTRLQEGLRHGAGHVATFEESGGFEPGPYALKEDTLRVGPVPRVARKRRPRGFPVTPRDTCSGA